MGNWEKQQEVIKEGKELDKSRRENLGKFFYDLGKVTFAGLVISSIMLFYSDTENINSIYILFTGLILTISCAWVGNRIFKRK